MKMRTWVVFSLICMVIAAGSYAAGVYAAPVRPKRAKLPPMTQSLALIDEVQIRVVNVPADMQDVGVTENLVKEKIGDLLKEGGVRVVEPSEKPDAPEVNFLAVAVREPKVGDALSYIYVLSLHQPVTIKGMEEELNLPTWMIPIVGLERDEDLQEPAFQNLQVAVDNFLRDHKRAKTEYEASN